MHIIDRLIVLALIIAAMAHLILSGAANGLIWVASWNPPPLAMIAAILGLALIAGAAIQYTYVICRDVWRRTK